MTTIDRLWYTRCPAPTPFGIAIQQGWLDEEFHAEGWDINALQDASDPVIRQSHYTHSQQHSFRQGGNIPALWARAQGADTRVIGLTWVDEFQGLIALPASGITSPEQLAGRRLGLPRNTRTEVVDFHRATALRGLTTLLSAAGLTLADVELVEFPTAPLSLSDKRATVDEGIAALVATERPQEFSREVLALARNEVDVVFVKGASGLEAANLVGARVIIDLSSVTDSRKHANNGTPRPLTVDAQLLSARPDVVARVLSRAIEAAQWASQHAEAARAYVGRETRTAEHWVRHAYPGELHQQLRIALDPDAISGLNDFKHFLFENKFIATDFDLANWIDDAPLAAAHALLSERRGAAQGVQFLK